MSLLSFIKGINTSRVTFWLGIAGLLVICIGSLSFIILIETAQNKATVQVAQHWRGAYDLLVRPASSKTVLEEKTKLVEENYLGTPHGGISLEQYEKIKSIPGIEAAAPVATVGYLLNSTGSIGLELNDTQPDTLYRAEMTLNLKDINRVIVDHAVGIFTYSDGDPPYLNGFSDLMTADHRAYASLGQLPVLWTLVAGIDPDQEAIISGIKTSIISGKYLTSGDVLEPNSDVKNYRQNSSDCQPKNVSRCNSSHENNRFTPA